MRLKHSESLDRLAQTSSQLEELHNNYSQVESEVSTMCCGSCDTRGIPLQLQNTTKRMTLLEGELEEWQTGKRKSEQIAQLQSEISAMETALGGMTEVTLDYYHCFLYFSALNTQNSSQYKLAMTEKEALLDKEQELQKSMQQEVIPCSLYV